MLKNSTKSVSIISTEDPILETAHQLGTPLSSLYGWITLLKESGHENSEAFIEMEKDIE